MCFGKWLGFYWMVIHNRKTGVRPAKDCFCAQEIVSFRFQLPMLSKPPTQPANACGPLFMFALIIAIISGSGCARPTSHYFVDALLSSAHHPGRFVSNTTSTSDGGSAYSKYLILAGDLHCHVTPPDAPFHVSRTLSETVSLARDEGLDFVVLSPHVRARFFLDEESRQYTTEALSQLELDVKRLRVDDMLILVGFEYTDFEYGHIGVAFGNLNEALAQLSVEQARQNPGAFFESYVSGGGLLFINHPLVTPLDSSLPMANADLSWRMFTERGPYPSEILTANRLALGFEAFNLTVFELRDRFLLSDPHITLRRTLTRLDKEIISQHRHMIPVGGSDSHSDHLRAGTFVLAERKSSSAIREALVAGRVCIRNPGACTFEAREIGRTWKTVGSSFSNVGELEIRAESNDLEFFVDGSVVYQGSARKTIRVRVSKERCTILRARVDEGYSAPIYANCAF